MGPEFPAGAIRWLGPIPCCWLGPACCPRALKQQGIGPSRAQPAAHSTAMQHTAQHSTQHTAVLCCANMLLLPSAVVAAVVLPTASAVASPCKFYTQVRQDHGAASPSCIEFDLTRLPRGVTYLLNDSYPEPYLVAGPCAVAACGDHCGTAACAKCQPVAPASAYQLKPGNTVQETCERCIGLGAAPVASAGPDGGLKLTTTGGLGRRQLVYNFVCDKSASTDAGPDAHVGTGGKHYDAHVGTSGEHYEVTWRTPVACGQPVAGAC
eukprot:COSAG01_NODE_20951_length_926_cov_1.100363_1_plen_265_part_10